MNLIGMSVTHKTFGTGEIVQIEKNKMNVAFPSAVKTFLYPNAFENYIIIKNQKAKDYIDDRLNQMKETKRQQQEQTAKKLLAMSYAVRPRKNSQAVFALEKEPSQNVFEDWCVSTGRNISGKSKGQPRIPKNVNANSACLLTTKPQGQPESERTILGIFMAENDFIGENCEDGNIQAHPSYRISWEEEQEPLLFWEYFPTDSRLEKWGSNALKYLPAAVIKHILKDMLELTEDSVKVKERQEFYQYFCEMNHL